jgi:hypothetical protein
MGGLRGKVKGLHRERSTGSGSSRSRFITRFAARSTPSVGGSRFYGFAAGTMQQADLSDGNFDAWKKIHAQFPPPQN